MSEYEIANTKLESTTASRGDAVVGSSKGSNWGLSFRVVRIGFCLVLADVVALIASSSIGFLSTLAIREAFNVSYSSEYFSVQSAHAFVTMAVIVLGCSWVWGHYSKFKPIWSEFAENCKAVAYAAAIVLAVLFVTKSTVSRTWLLTSLLTLMIFLPVGRQYMKSVLARYESWFTPLIVIGSGTNAKESAKAVSSDVSLGYKIVGYIPLEQMEKEKLGEKIVEVTVYARQFDNPRLLFAPDNISHESSISLLMESLLSIDDQLLISFPVRRLPLNSLESLNVFRHDAMLLRAKNSLSRPFHRFIKRVFDIVVSFLLIVLLSPVFLFLYVAVRLDGGPALYGSKRIGRDGEEFLCYKFRTMATDSEAVLQRLLETNKIAREEWEQNFKLRKDPRISKIGGFLRKTSFDELPQLFQVLEGKMSLVGPRPILPDEVTSYGDSMAVYCLTRPGITGLWQVSGRSNLSYKGRVAMNNWYTKNWSLWVDVIVLLKTVPAILKTSNAS